MIRLIYVSSATRDLSEQDLVSLLEQAHERNTKQNVTGMLLYAEGILSKHSKGKSKILRTSIAL